MLGVFAEFETNLRRERQLEGIAKAKAACVYKGRPASIDAAQVRAMKAQGLGALRKSQRPSRSAGSSCGTRLKPKAGDPAPIQEARKTGAPSWCAQINPLCPGPRSRTGAAFA
jgi:DNA invertase Pin-like site-specific DNA recombinase